MQHAGFGLVKKVQFLPDEMSGNHALNKGDLWNN